MGCSGVPIEEKKRRPSQTEILDIEFARTDLKILENRNFTNNARYSIR